MESPFTEIPVSTGKPHSQWNNNDDEIMIKNPLLNPGQTESSESEFSFESISRGVDEYFSKEFETNKTGEHFDNYRNESSVDNELASYETDLFNEETNIESYDESNETQDEENLYPDETLREEQVPKRFDERFQSLTSISEFNSRALFHATLGGTVSGIKKGTNHKAKPTRENSNVRPHCSPENVQYLALEGGGGRGAVYIGAIMALERQDILPITRNKIKGISGSSAGAITAFLLSLGYTGNQIQDKLLLQKKQPPVFGNFIDDIEPGCFREITNDFKAAERRIRTDQVIDNFINADLVPIQNQLKLGLGKKVVTGLILGPSMIPVIEKYLKELPELMYSTLNSLIISMLYKQAPMIGSKLSVLDSELHNRTKIPSIYNLLHDGGFFTGFGVRRVLRSWFDEYNRTKDNRFDSNINFEQFYRLTGVDLKITGTNITDGFGAFFSKDTTPKFPVIEAVGISGCFPFVFKPIWVESNDPILDGLKVYDERIPGYKEKTLRGLWADGGIANNLPLHAFDTNGVLNQNVLALRLTPPKKSRVNLSQMTNPTSVKNSTWDYYSSLLSLLTSPSEESQIRSGLEALQTIDLDTGSLATTDFTPRPEIWGAFSSMAYAKVKKFFTGI